MCRRNSSIVEEKAPMARLTAEAEDRVGDELRGHTGEIVRRPMNSLSVAKLFPPLLNTYFLCLR